MEGKTEVKGKKEKGLIDIDNSMVIAGGRQDIRGVNGGKT